MSKSQNESAKKQTTNQFWLGEHYGLDNNEIQSIAYVGEWAMVHQLPNGWPINAVPQSGPAQVDLAWPTTSK